jgi:hypothetical protein
MSDELRDVDTFFEEKKQREEYTKLIESAKKTARGVAEDIVDTAKKANQAVMEKLENNIKLSQDEKKSLLNHDQNILRKKIMTELVQTKASMILVNNKIKELTSQNEKLIQKAALDSGYEQIVAKGKIKSNNSIILKLQLQQQYLEGIFNELSTALDNMKEMIIIDRVTPIAQKVTDLLSEVDRIQAESNALAGRAEESEANAKALRDLEDEI